MSQISRRRFLQGLAALAAAGLAKPLFKFSALAAPAGISGGWMPDNPLPGQLAGPAAVAAPAGPSAAPAAYQLQTPHQALLMDVSAAVWDARWTQLTNQGYRTTRVEGVDNSGVGASYSGIFVRDGLTDWYEWRGMDHNSYQTKFDDYAATGYIPISVSGYQDNGATRFAAVWLKQAAAYTGIHDATNAQYQSFVNTNINTYHLRPLAVDGYPVSGADYYISIWSDLGSGNWLARHGNTATDLVNNWILYNPQGYRVTDASGYNIGGTAYFAYFMVQDNRPSTLWYGTPSFIYSKAVDNAKADLEPNVIDSYDDSGRKFVMAHVQRTRAWSTSGAAAPGLGAFDSAMQTFMQDRGVHSATLAVTKDSRLVLARAYRWDYDNIDPVQPESVFRIASLSKALTSMAVMRLIQEGSLALTSKLVSLVALPGPLVDSRINNINVEHLLHHTGGWDRDSTNFDPMFADQTIASALGVSLPVTQANIIRYMSTIRPLDFAPGSQYHYSNYGYLLLGRIIEAVSGQSYLNYMQQHVFAPLHLKYMALGRSEMELRQSNEVAYYQTDPGLYGNVRHAGAPVNAMGPYGWFNIENMDSHGGWLASAIDLVRFTTAFDASSGFPVLDPASIASIFAIPPLGAFNDGSWYGCGWAARSVTGGQNAWHNGSLPGTYTFMVRRYDHVNYVVLFNQRDDPSGLDISLIDPVLYGVADGIGAWPKNVEYFPQFGYPAHGRGYLPHLKR